jgi:hypothetical protein
MFEIFGVIAAVGGIAELARGRGGIPWLWGSVALAGYLLTEFLTGLILVLLHTRESVVPLVAGWLWIATVAIFLRFGLGRQHSQPDSAWSCANCKTLNKKSSVLCEACKQTWESQQSGAATSA